MSDVLIQRLAKRHSEMTEHHGIDLDMPRGEFLTLLAPHACGKSATLFALTGLDKPSGGYILVGGRTFYDGETELSSRRRNTTLALSSSPTPCGRI
jgi:ABC-type Fe3+/spermidine/putrescine transport system ATPase subunit